MKCGFSSTFQGREYSIWATNRGKVLPSKAAFHLLFILPKSSFGVHNFRTMLRATLKSSSHIQ
jgi:hypothetical protein